MGPKSWVELTPPRPGQLGSSGEDLINLYEFSWVNLELQHSGIFTYRLHLGLVYEWMTFKAEKVEILILRENDKILVMVTDSLLPELSFAIFLILFLRYFEHRSGGVLLI